MRSALLSLVTVFAVGTTTQGASLLVQLKFDGNLANSGSLGGVASSFGDPATGFAGSSLPAYSQSFSSVQNPNPSTHNFGEPDKAGGADLQNAGIGNLGAFTITGWFKLDSALVGDNTLLFSSKSQRKSTGDEGFGLWLRPDGKMTYHGYHNDPPIDWRGDQVSPNAVFTASNTADWQFVAVTLGPWAQPGESHRIDFYGGTESSSVVHGGHKGARPYGLNDLFSVAGSWYQGWGLHHLNAYLQDFRLYDGVLDVGQIEAVRLAAIPEPASLGLLGLACLATLGRRRRS